MEEKIPFNESLHDIIDIGCGEEFERWKRITSEQKDDFEIQYPWEAECKHGDIYYICKDKLDTVLGWMRITIESHEYSTNGSEYPDRELILVTVLNISTSKKYKNVGRNMMEKMERDMKGMYDLIVLRPLPAVIGFYNKLGYRVLREDKTIFPETPEGIDDLSDIYYKWISTKDITHCNDGLKKWFIKENIEPELEDSQGEDESVSGGTRKKKKKNKKSKKKRRLPKS
jgi:hypothetical protein